MHAPARTPLDILVDWPLLQYVVAAALALLVALVVPESALRLFVKSSLPAIPGVAFSLFGFAITAISIMVTLKGMPYFDVLQRQNFRVWKALIGSFIHEASLFALFGLLALIIPADIVPKAEGIPFLALKLGYLFLLFLVALATVSAVYMLRLVANTPPLDEPRQHKLDTSALDTFVNPTDKFPPREL